MKVGITRDTKFQQINGNKPPNALILGTIEHLLLLASVNLTSIISLSTR